MAKRGPDEIFLLVGGIDLGQEMHELTLEKSALLEEITPFGKTFVDHTAVGVSRGFVDLLAMYDDADNNSAEALDSQEGLERVMTVMWGGNIQASKMTGLRVNEQTHTRNVSREELTKNGAHFESSEAIEEGVVIQPLAAESGAGVTSAGSHDFGASGTRLAGYLEVTELTLGGYDSITVKIQESSNDGAGDAFADKVTFTNITAETVGERIAINATVEQFVRVTLTLNGSGSSESITLLVAITS